MRGCGRLQLACLVPEAGWRGAGGFGERLGDLKANSEQDRRQCKYPKALKETVAGCQVFTAKEGRWMLDAERQTYHNSVSTKRFAKQRLPGNQAQHLGKF